MREGPLSNDDVVALLKKEFVCVEELIGTRYVNQIPEEHRKHLEPFAEKNHDGRLRFYFGRVRVLSWDGRDIGDFKCAATGVDRYADDEERKKDCEKFVGVLKKAAEENGRKK